MILRKSYVTVLLTLSLFLSLSLIAQEKGENRSGEWTTKRAFEKSYDELKKITQQEHTPKLKQKQLKVFLKPGVYKAKGTLTFNKRGSNGQNQKKTDFEFTHRIKYVNGKYIVAKVISKKLKKWVVITYQKNCRCFRNWGLKNGQINSVGIGNHIKDKNLIAWSFSSPAVDRKNIANIYELHSEDRRSMQERGTSISGERIVQLNFNYTFQRPLSDESTEDDKQNENENEKKSN